MIRLRPGSLMALSLLLAFGLAGCGGRLVNDPTVKSTGGVAARNVAQPTLTPQTGTGVKSVANYLTNLGATQPTFSPQGDHLAFVTPSRGILIATADAGSPQNVPGTRAGDHDPAWAPDGGSLLAVRAGASGGTEIVRLTLSSPQSTVLYSAPASLQHPAWLPGGTSLIVAVQPTSAAASGELLRWDAATGKATALWQGNMAGAPTVSPDGRGVVFATANGLARLPLPTGSIARLAVVGTQPRDPSFSASGKSLAYVANDGLYVGAADGSQAKRVANGSGFASPAWSPLLPVLVVGLAQGSRTDLDKVALAAR